MSRALSRLADILYLCKHDVGCGLINMQPCLGQNVKIGQRGATRRMQRQGIIDGAVRPKRDDEQSCSKIVQSDSTVMGVRSSYEISEIRPAKFKGF